MWTDHCACRCLRCLVVFVTLVSSLTCRWLSPFMSLACLSQSLLVCTLVFSHLHVVVLHMNHCQTV